MSPDNLLDLSWLGSARYPNFTVDISTMQRPLAEFTTCMANIQPHHVITDCTCSSADRFFNQENDVQTYSRPQSKN
jgi:hypothetical protein